MGEPLSSLDRSSTNVSLTMLDSVIGFIAGLLFDSSRLDSIPIPWARKRGVDWRDSSTGGDPTRFDARGGEVAPEGVRDDLPTKSSSIDRDAAPTTTRDVEPKTWALARHGLAESATSIARHPPGRGLDDA